MASEVGVAYLPIVPTFKGIRAELDKALGPAADAAGRAAGVQAGDGVRGGVTEGLKGTASEAGRAGQDAGRQMHSGILSGMGGLTSAVSRGVAGAGAGVARSFGLSEAFSRETANVAGLARGMGASFSSGMRGALAELRNTESGMNGLGRTMTGVWSRGSVAITAVRGQVQNFQAGVRGADSQTGSLSSTVGRLGSVVGSVGSGFRTFQAQAAAPVAQIKNGFQEAATHVTNFGVRGVAALGGVAAGVAGIALTGGVNRALQIEQAEAKLKGLGNSTQNVNLIMQNALASVKGTSYGLNDAATVAASAVAAGIQPGNELQGVLKTVANSAAIAGTDMASMGSIFNKVAASGHLQGDELMQLSDAGVPALQFLAKETGKTSAQVSDMVAKGQIDFKTFASAMEHGVGDSATQMGKTTSGSFDNMKAALSRLGAGAVQPFLPLVAKLFGGLTAGADAISAKVGPAFKWLGDRATEMVGALSQIGNTNVLTQDIVRRMGFSADSPLGRGMVELVGGIRAFAAAWRAADGDVTSTGFPGFMERCANAIRGFLDWASKLSGGAIAGMAAVFVPLITRVSGVAGEMQNLVGWIQRFDGPVGAAVRAFLPFEGILGGLAGALRFIGGPWGTVISLMVAAYTQSAPLRQAFSDLVGAFVNVGQQIWNNLAPAFQMLSGQGGAVSGFFQGLVDKVSALLQVIVPVVTAIVNQFAPVIGTVIGVAVRTAVTVFGTMVAVIMKVTQFLMPLVTNLVSFLAPAITAVTGFVADFVSVLAGPVMTVLGVVAGVIAGVVVGFMAFRGALMVARGAMILYNGVMAVFNAIMAMNPIVLVVLAIAGLVAALVVAYNRIGWFKDAVNAAWNGIKTVTAVVWNGILAVIRGVVSWFQTSVLPIFQGAISVLGTVFNWLWHSVIQPVWYGIRVTIAVVVAILMTIFQAIVAVISVTLAPVFMWLWHSIIQPAWNGIRTAISAVGDWFMNTLLPFFQGAIRNLGGFFRWLYENVIRPVWSAIKGFIDLEVRGIKIIWNGVVSFLRNVLGPIFHWLYDHVIKPIWSGIKWFIDTEIRGIKIIWNSVIDFIRGPLARIFRWLYDNVIKPVWDAISAAIRWAWEHVIRPIWNGIKAFIENVLVPAFKFLQDRVGAIWDAISGKIRAVWDGIKNSILTPMMDFLKGTVVDAFNKAKDGIKSAWDKIQDIVKTPVSFVINTVVRDGFVNNFNKIASTFGIDPIDFKGVGWSSGGWTGPGEKYDVAGVVHADEFVINKAARQQIERDNPGLLETMNNTGALPQSPLPATRAPKTGEAYTAPPHGPGTEVWSSMQAAASNAGHMYFPSGNFMGVDIASAAKAWMGQSAMEIRLGHGSPGIQSFRTGGNGGWGFEDGTNIWMQPSVPQNRRRGVLIHEMGHALGLAHPAMGDSSTIMDHMMTHKPDWPSADDYRALRDLWGPPGAGVKKYAYDGQGGDGDGGGWKAALYDHTVGAIISGLIDKIPGSGFPHDIMVGGAKKLSNEIRDWVTGQDGDGGDAEGSQTESSGGTAKVREWMTKALKATGNFSETALNAGVRRAMQESGGNPNAQNNWDSNARAGTPSKGLMQVIGPTFKQFMMSGHGNILDPVDNAIASIRYTLATYGSLLKGWGRAGGYAEGGLVKRPTLYDNGGIIPAGSGVQVIDHQRDTPDYVLTDRQWQIAQRGMELATSHGNIHVHMEGKQPEDPTVFGRRVGESLAFEVGKVIA